MPGNTADPTAFVTIAKEIQAPSGVDDMVMVGDPGMITSAIQAPAGDTGLLQMSLLDERNLAEISYPDYAAERLIACYNPALATLRKHKREQCLDVTEERLKTIQKGAPAGRSKDAGNGSSRTAATVTP